MPGSSVLHVGPKNPQSHYTIEGTMLNSVTLQKDLGITVTNNLKWETHIIEIVKRANSLLYMIRKAFSYITAGLFLKLYKTYVRPLLEYGYQIWSPYFQKDISLLERAQKQATKMVASIRNLSYEDRLEALALTTLEERRHRGDLIETYKILTERYDVAGIKLMYAMNKNDQLRGHSLKLNRTSCHSNPRKHFIASRVVDSWNRLPEEVISATSVINFKNKLDAFLKSAKRLERQQK